MRVKSHNEINKISDFCRKIKKTGGFSLTELLVVLAVIAVLTAISLPYAFNYQKLGKSDDQAMQIMDLMNEAAQMALTRRRTFRFEIDLTDNKALLIDERGAGAADDTEIKAISLLPTSEVRVNQIPSGVSRPNPPNYNDAVFATDTIGHRSGNTTVTGHNVWAVRFQSNGSAVNNLGTPLSANLYVWIPQTTSGTNPLDRKLVRAITLFGASGAIRYWKHNGSAFVPY